MNAKIQSWQGLALIYLMGTAASISPAWAQNITPANDGIGTVINNNGQRFDITGGTTSGNGANLFHSFQQFNLDAGQTANFVSAPNIHNILGRVTGGNASIINGLIQVTGGNSNLYLMNPAGVLFGPSASLNVPASFSVTTATGIGFGNNWFNAVGNNNYQSLVGTPSGYRFDVSQPGAIVNAGNLELSPGEDLTLTGGTVINTGELSTSGGNVTIAAVEGGDTIRISQPGHLLNLEVSNFGGNQEEITPLSLPGLLTEGNANSHATGMTVNESGEVVLSRNRVSGKGGTAIASGTIDTSSSNIGGEVNVLGSQVGVLDANINANGINGGGDVFIGGGFQGNSRLPASEQTVINNSIISASAIDTGDGGQVVAWSDGTTRFEGNIRAIGGEFSGSGGMVEVSGKERLFVNGNIDAGAARGETGTILFDPKDIVIDEIDDSETENQGDIFAEDENGNATISASQLEELEGEITLQADNDIIVNQEINTSESVEFNAGRSINLNADIDTSSGNGNISLLGNDSGANAANRSEGAANIIQRENTTLNAGAGNINIRLGSLGEVGEINLENLTTTGRVLINANGGNIGRVSPNSLIAAGDAILTTIGEGSIGFGEEPLRVEVNNLEATAGSGGIFVESLQGINLTGITTTGGGNIQLNVEGNVTLGEEVSTAVETGKAGDIEIVSSGGINARRNSIISSSQSGSGGDVSLRATANLNTGDIDATSGSNRRGGNISLESSGGNIVTTNGTLDTSSIGGNAGTIELNAAGDITAGTLRAASRSSGPGKPKDNNVETIGNVSPPDPDEATGESSGSTTESNGDGGAIALTAGGKIDTTEGALNSSSSSGGGGDVTMNAARVIRTDSINSSGTDRNGGNINLSSSEGSIDTTEGALDARSQFGDGGNITLDAARNVSTQILLSRSTESEAASREGGRIIITAETGFIDTREGSINSSSESGNAGRVLMRAGEDVRTNDITARGSEEGNGGNIRIESSGGSIDTSLGELDARAKGGDGGNILLEAAGDIVTSDIETVSSSSAESKPEAGAGQDAGAIDLVNEVASTEGLSGSGGNITLRAGGALRSLGKIDSSSEFGSGGNVGLTATGDINIDELTSKTDGSGDGGNVFIESSQGAIAVSGIINSTAVSGRGGNIDLNAAEDVRVRGIISRVSSNEDTTEDNSQTTGDNSQTTGDNSQTTGDNSQPTTREARNAQQQRNQGGNVTITAGGSVDATGSKIDSSSSRGAGGNIAITAAGNISAADLDSKGDTQGGEIAITSTDGGVNTTQGKTESSAETGIGGDIAIEGNQNVVTRDVVSSGNRGGGNIEITSAVGDVDTSSGKLDASSENGVGGDLTINAPLGSIAIGTIEGDGITNEEQEIAEAITTERPDATQEDLTEENGVVRLEAHNDITIDEAIASNSISSLEMRAGRNIDINANINTARSNGDVTIEANYGGADADLRGRGRGNFRMAEGTTINAGRGDITISLGTFGSDNNIGNITLANIRTRGTFSVDARGGNILSVSDSSLVRAGTGVFQTFGDGGIGSSEAPLRIDVGVLEAKAGSGGAFFYSPNGGLTVGSDEEPLVGVLTTEGGDVEIEVEGDITVAEPISTAVDSGEGGNISLTAAGAIATGESVLSSTSGEGNGGNITLTGDGDVTVGDISSYSRRSGNGGNIIINSGGAVDTTAGSLVSRANSGDGGAIRLKGDLELTTGRIESTSRNQGRGGDITLESSNGNVDTTGGEISSSANQGDGGNISITAAEGDVTAGNIESESDSDGDEPGRGGSIEISAGGNVDTTRGELSSSSSRGSGGDIAIAAGGNLETGAIDSNAGFGGGGSSGQNQQQQRSSITGRMPVLPRAGNADGDNAGNIQLEAGGSINTTAGSLSSISVGGNGGNITLSSNGTIQAGNINTLSEGTGSGGNITLESRRGAIDTAEGELSSISSQGDGGNVALNARLDVLTGDINTLSEGNGGSISIESRRGGIDTTEGQLNSRSKSGRGGSVTLSANGDILTGDVNSFSQGEGLGGDIVLESDRGIIDTTEGQFTSNSARGDGGNISITGTRDILTGSITSIAESNGSGGNLTLETTGGVIDTTAGRLSSSSFSGNGGNVSLTATGDINTGVIDSFSQDENGSGNGGNITLNSGGNIDTTGNVLSSRADGDGNGGNVSLTAQDNITTAKVESFSDRSGRGGNIGMNAGGNIDATDGELLSRSNGGDGGNVTLTAQDNITTAKVESFSEGSGRGGNIEMNAGGNIDATQERLISRSDSGDGGNVTLRAQDNITTAKVESFSNGSGRGGNIEMNAGGDIDATGGELVSRSRQGTGGNVTLNGQSNITTAIIESLSEEGTGGDINIDAVGNIDTTDGKLTSRSNTGDGGNVNLSSAGNITTAVVESLSRGGRGGDININAEGNINTSGGELTSRSDAGDGGNVSLRSGSNISTGAIESLSQDGRGGDIGLNARGEADTSGGELISRSQTGEGGNVSLRAEGNISTGFIESFSGEGIRGGSIEIISGNGSVNTTVGDLSGEPQITPNADVSTRQVATTFQTERANLSSFAPEGIGGNVTIEAKGDVTTSHISSFGGEDSGDVRIITDGNIETGVLFSTAIEGIGGEIDIISNNNGNIDIEHIAAYSQNNTGGEIEIGASGSVTVNNVASFGPQQSGDVSITSDGGTITTGTVQTRAPNGTSGNITLNTFSVRGDIRTANVSTVGGRAAGAVRVLAADGSVTTENLQSSSSGGTAGGIDVEAGDGDVSTGDQTVNAGQGDANINVGASGNISTGNQTATTNNGNASINNVAGGNVTVGGNQTATATGGNASINNNAGGNVTVGGDQTAIATGGNASINNVAGGNVTVGGDQTAIATGGNASINNVAGGNVTVGGDQTAIATGGNASINNVAGGNVTVGGDQTAIATGGNASINNVAGGNVTVGGDQTALSQGGNAFINNDAGGNLTIGVQTAIAPEGINQVSNNAGGTTNTNLEIGNGDGVGPVVLTQPPVAITPPSVSTPELTAPAASVSTAELTAPAASVSAQTMDTQAGAIAANDSSFQNQVLDLTNPTGSQSQNDSNSSNINANSDTQQILERTDILNSGSITVAANSETLTMLEENRTQEFADYLGLDPSELLNSSKNVREMLVDIEKQTGNRSAVVYVTAYPENLQVVLYTASGEPILKTVPEGSREEVLKLVQDLNYRITSPRFRYGQAYLQPAQQLYQWLIAPIAAELEAANIDTLLFSMDAGMRRLPVAALHDGEQFLIENYSLSIIPSVSLMDSRYRSLEDTRVLAMGASEFMELNPLPAVPVELQTIAQQLWEGQAHLNQEFTVDNLIAQRQDYAYPIIHLATHGQFLPGDASNSYIQFWGEEKLTLDRVRELGLNNPTVELLILSACRTAVGDTNAELGFAGLAVAAGVKSAVASLWYVSDEGTLGLMTEFYSHLDDVTIKAEALRQAQLGMLRGDVKIEDGQLRSSGTRGGVLALPPALAHILNADLSHPYYWSAFTMIGSPW